MLQVPLVCPPCLRQATNHDTDVGCTNKIGECTQLHPKISLCYQLALITQLHTYHGCFSSAVAVGRTSGLFTSAALTNSVH
jgi:hypothetical protein